jgi:PAS domain S-box-containing protein
VDDNTGNLQFLTKILGDAGYQAFPASDGELALEFIHERPPDLILLDVKMPGMDGEEVCRRLKADPRTHDVPVIFLSALESEADRVRCFKAGGVDYVCKPFRPEEVLARVETHLALRRVQLDLEKRNAELAAAQVELEDRVQRRTAELAAANASLVAEVSERKRAEAEASASRRFLDAIVDALADPVFVTDREGRLVRVNDALCGLTGRCRDELLGRPDPELFPGETGRAFHARNSAVIAAAGAAADEERLDDGGGTRRVLLIRRTLCRDARGEPFLVGVMRDVTEYERMQERVLQSQKMETIGMLAGGVAHDFNNLLAPILACTESMLADGIGPPWQEMARDMYEAARSGKGLTQRLLAFSRKQRFELRRVDLRDLVRGFEPMIRRTLREDVELRLELPEQLAEVLGDPAQLQQVLANLAVNAQDAMPRGGTLVIGGKEVELDEVYVARHREVQPGRYVALSVTDSGCGMPPEVMAHLFEPFFTTKEQGKGTGLGLSTVFGIVKQHGGSISVYSEAGRGTTFQIFLPFAPGAAAAAAAPGVAPSLPQATPGRGETVVVAEDDERVRRTTVRMLKGLGYAVLEAPDAARCIELVRGHEGSIALLVSDVIMPGMHGRELYEAVHQLRPELKVLFMSGYPSLVVGGKDDLGPGFPFIQKPFARRDLAEKVREVIDGTLSTVPA